MKKKPTHLPRAMHVRDRQLEVGVNLNTVFTAIMLGVMSWVGFNIESIKDRVSEFSASIAVVQEGGGQHAPRYRPA